jgi:hypothetical protein
MNIEFMNTLESIAFEQLPSNVKDGKACDYINNLVVPHGQAYLKNEYKKYYFSCKKDFTQLYNRE